MRTMAQVNENGIVVNIIVAGNDWNTEGFIEYTEANPAYIGGVYADGKFIPPKPSPDAIFDEESCRWIVPSQIEYLSSMLSNADTV
jgi:hypothetical protein